MKIALDAMCGDFGAEPNIIGAARAAEELGYEIILVGDEKTLKAKIAEKGCSHVKNLSVVHTSQFIGMDAEPAAECKAKKDSSIMLCAKLVKDGKADAFVSAGNSGASMVASFLNLKRIKGVSRPAIGAPLPTLKGHCVLLDAGANADCTPENLLHFAVMGSAYAEKAFDIVNPSVGLLSIGEEEGKGSQLIKDTTPHIKNLGLNYYGAVEGRDIPAGTTDVVVTDGFTGNICLKLSEGWGKTLFALIKREVSKNILHALGMKIAMPSLRRIKDKTDPDQYGGAPLLGVDGVAIICHGKAGGLGIFNAIKLAGKLVDNKFVQTIADGIEKYKNVFEQLQ